MSCRADAGGPDVNRRSGRHDDGGLDATDEVTAAANEGLSSVPADSRRDDDRQAP